MSAGLDVARTRAGGHAGLAGRRRGARPPAGPRRPRDVDVVVDGDPARGRARGRARGAGAPRASRCRRTSAPGAWSRASTPGRSTSSRCAAQTIEADLGAARLHGQRDRRADRRRSADRPARRPGGPARRGACGWPAPGAFADDPLRVLRLVRLAVELDLEPDARDAARAPRAARGALTRRVGRAGVRGAAADHRRAAGARGAWS